MWFLAKWPLYIHLPTLVCDDHVFKDDKLFYRFRKDDGTFEEPPDAAILAKGQRIYGRYGHFMTIMCLEFHTLRGVFSCTCITTFACMYTKLIVHLCMICTHYLLVISNLACLVNRQRGLPVNAGLSCALLGPQSHGHTNHLPFRSSKP